MRANLPNPDATLHVAPATPVKVRPSRPSSAAGGSAPSTATGGTNITGLDQSGAGGWGPSDVTAAAGTNDVVETVNEAMSMYSKSGTTQYTTSLQNWFGCGSSCSSIFDPHVTFETFGNR